MRGGGRETTRGGCRRPCEMGWHPIVYTLLSTPAQLHEPDVLGHPIYRGAQPTQKGLFARDNRSPARRKKSEKEEKERHRQSSLLLWERERERASDKNAHAPTSPYSPLLRVWFALAQLRRKKMQVPNRSFARFPSFLPRETSSLPAVATINESEIRPFGSPVHSYPMVCVWKFFHRKQCRNVLRIYVNSRTAEGFFLWGLS